MFYFARIHKNLCESWSVDVQVLSLVCAVCGKAAEMYFGQGQIPVPVCPNLSGEFWHVHEGRVWCEPIHLDRFETSPATLTCAVPTGPLHCPLMSWVMVMAMANDSDAGYCCDG